MKQLAYAVIPTSVPPSIYHNLISLFLRKFQINMNLRKKWPKGYSP